MGYQNSEGSNPNQAHQIKISDCAQTQMLNVNYRATERDLGCFYMNKSTNISVMDKAFKVVSNSARMIDMVEFSNNLTKENIKIRNQFTCVTDEYRHRDLVGIREAPYLPLNAHSLPSRN